MGERSQKGGRPDFDHILDDAERRKDAVVSRQIPQLHMPPSQEGPPRKEAVAIGPLFHDVEIRVALISDERCGYARVPSALLGRSRYQGIKDSNGFPRPGHHVLVETEIKVRIQRE